MAVPQEFAIRLAVDELLDPIWASEQRRRRRRRLASDLGRLLLLLVVPIVLTLLGGLSVGVPALLYFLGLGVFCVFGADGRLERSGERSRGELATR